MFYRFFEHCTNYNHTYWLMLSGLRCTLTEDQYCTAGKCILSMSYNLLDDFFLLLALYFTLKSRYKHIDVIPILWEKKGIMLLLVVSKPFISPLLCYSVMNGWVQHSQTATPEVTGCNLYGEPVCLPRDRRWRQQIHMSASLKQSAFWSRGTRTARRCQTLGALPVHRLIIGHPSTLLWSPVELWALWARHLFHILLVLACFLEGCGGWGVS